jgi:small subunit ribosomal protein S6
MAANVYECMFVLDTTKVSGDVPAAAQQLHNLLEKHHVEVLASRPWDERRLSYPIKNQKKGLYYLTYFRADGKNLTELKHDFALNEMILRLLIIKIDPKLVDTMLALARDEHALVALHNYKDDQMDEGEGRPEGGRRERERERVPVGDVEE